MNARETLLGTITAPLLCTLIGLIPHFPYSQDNFYEGKTITHVATTAPGGTGYLRVKAVVPFLKKHVTKT
ncbi:MAG TPA: hypothetical protein VE616_11710 [Candidatus Udaeobacter sp.]|jgi:hypothetical protein|nr:hypothetical protein [Candidatus Udaeobacter sp.]